jgi:hypothetical protein
MNSSFHSNEQIRDKNAATLLLDRSRDSILAEPERAITQQLGQITISLASQLLR